MHTIDTDNDLLLAYRSSGGAQWVSQLYKRYASLVYGLCLKYLKDRALAQDAVMDIFEKLIVKLKTEEVDHFKSWLYMVAKNHCLMQLRKVNKEINTPVMEMPVAVHHNDDSAEENLQQLEDCIEALKEDQRECVSLFYLQRMSYQQVSESVGMDLKAVKSYIQNGKRNLKICMERKNAEA